MEKGKMDWKNVGGKEICNTNDHSREARDANAQTMRWLWAVSLNFKGNMQRLICRTWQQLVSPERLTESASGKLNHHDLPFSHNITGWSSSGIVLNYFISGYFLHIKSRCSAEIFEKTSGVWERKENEVLPLFKRHQPSSPWIVTMEMLHFLLLFLIALGFWSNKNIFHL